MDDRLSANALQKALFKLNDQELRDLGITQVSGDDSLMWAVASSSANGDEENAIIQALEAVGIHCMGSCSRGYCTWYVSREDFFAARKVLLQSAAVSQLHIVVVTPQTSSQ